MATLDALPGKARVLNEYGEGGWIIWRARDTSPAIDGQSEIYGSLCVSAYLSALTVQPGWRAWVARGDFDAAWLYARTPLANRLQADGWTVRQRAGDSVVLLPPDRP